MKSTKSHRLLLAGVLLLAAVVSLAAHADGLTDLGRNFRAALAAKVQVADKNYDSVVQGRDGWMFFVPELRHVAVGQFWGEAAPQVSRAAQPEYSDPLPAIVDFKNQLQSAGIELLLVPVPPKAAIYPDKLDTNISADETGPPRVDEFHQQFYALLREQGVNVLDLTSEFLQSRDGDRPLYCKQDTHWSGRACVLAARHIASSLGEKPWLTSTPRKDLKEQWKRVTIQGDLLQSLPAAERPAAESLALRFVGTPSGNGLQPMTPDRNSPVLLLGDSHALVFQADDDMHTKGAGLADQLALEWGFPVDLIAVRGSGATPARTNLLRRARADKNYLAGKKLVIWCFSAREFTESLGWQKVPVTG